MAKSSISRRQRRATPSVAASRGVAIIEVMVALLIFTLGVLGLIGLYANLTRAQSDSKFRADAAYLSAELIGRMWSDLGNVANYQGDGCDGVANCKEWKTKVATLLPGGQAQIAAGTGTGSVQVTVRWTLPSGETHSYVTVTTLAPKVAG